MSFTYHSHKPYVKTVERLKYGGQESKTQFAIDECELVGALNPVNPKRIISGQYNL